MAHPKTKRGGTKRATQVVPTSDRGTLDRMYSPLREARMAAGLSQEDLERISGLTQATISKVELRIGDYGHLELATARRFARALNSTVDALFPEPKRKGAAS